MQTIFCVYIHKCVSVCVCLFPLLASSELMLPAYYCVIAGAAKSLQSCPTLCDPIDGSPPGPTIPGILQARPPEWVTISFSNA